MDSPSTVITILDRAGVAVGVLIVIVIGIWKAGPRVAAFLTSLTDENKAMTKALNAMTEQHAQHHAITLTKLESLHDHVDTKIATLEANMRENGLLVAEKVGRDVRETGQHVALTAREAIETVARQPTNPDIQTVSIDRPSPTPTGLVRPALPPRISRPALTTREPTTREASRPSWERVEK